MNRKAGDSGYTIIEVTTVILIISILILVAIPVFFGMRDRAFDTQARANIRNGMVVAKQYFTDEETYIGMNAARLKQYVPTAPFADIATDCLTTPPGGDSIHGVINVQTGLTDGSACIAVWSKGTDKRYAWTVSSTDVETLSIR